jgi:hypothetical protein
MPRDPNTRLPQPVFDEPTFNEGTSSPDPTKFTTPHPSDDAQYKKIEDLLTKDTVSFDASRLPSDGIYTLAEALGPHGDDEIAAITKSGQIIFQAFGDSGAAATRNYAYELHVSDQVTNDYHSSKAANRPTFLYHLGDIVYNFGESKYYYDQFYEPYRNYPAPIFAIPGNHDSFIIPGTAAADDPLTIFSRNFCSEHPTITAEAGSLHRTAMTQPGVYFALDCPFHRIIGLFSNALEDPGLISSQGSKWKGVPDIQLDYLTAQLKLIKSQNYQGAVILATHHPPFTYEPPPNASGAGGYHGSSTDMLREIDTICAAEGVYPHVHLSGHAHNYQRYTRSIKFANSTYQVPFIICGSGGHAINPLVQASKGTPAQEPANGTDVTYLESNPAVTVEKLVLENHNDQNYGYLRILVNQQQLQIVFHPIRSGSGAAPTKDTVTVNLKTHSLATNSASHQAG